MPALQVLIVEDNPDDADLLLRELRRAGFDPEWSRVETEPEFLTALQHPLAIILSDYSMPHFSGLRALELLRASGRDIPFILISGTVGEDVAVQAMRDGATDYLLKDRPARLASAVRRALAETQQRAARQQAEAAQAQLAAIVTSSADAIIGKDLNGIITSWNGGAERIFGYTTTEMVGTSILRLIPADREDEEEHILGRIRQSENIEHFETLRQTKDGRLIDVSVTASPIRNATGQVTGVSKVARDISERKRSEKEQRFQQAMLKAERELTLDAILVVDDQSRVLSFNGRFAQMWGISADILSTRADTVLLQAVRDKLLDPERFMDHVRQLYDRHDQVSHDEVELTDGRMLDRYSAPMRDPDGRYYGRVWYFRDVTERKEAEGALRHERDRVRTAEARMRFALESADVGIWDMDYGTGALRWSEILEAQYGLQPGTFAGTFEAFVERIHPEDRESVLETMGKAMKSGTDFSVVNRTIRPDGTVRWLSGAGRVLLDEHGQPLRGVGISQDVTERRTLEEQYQQAQKMEAVGRLAGGVAHDFNNLLTVILGYCELLLADCQPGDPHQEDIAEIQRAGARASGLTRQLLAFSRKQIIEPTVLDLNAIATDMQAMLGRLIGEDVNVVLVLGPDLAPVKADRGQVEQVLMNLAVNARDAMPKGGTLTIETANVELDERYAKTHATVTPGPYVALTVTDTGTGMTPEVQARLFEPFFTTKEIGKGTGLGMATVYGIVARSGGSVGVYSEIGKGSSFKVYFPRVETADMVMEAPRPVAPVPVGMQTVLVVEDEDGLRELARKLLLRQGYTVLVAANADEALRLVAANASIDVLLTDVVMPGASGPELTRQLVEQRPALRVIYMSGYTEDAIVQRGVLKPGIAFLNKPFTSETLGAKIREVLER
jgi:two-component system, cell cycle sensor histidine kinase and response regulator CckA